MRPPPRRRRFWEFEVIKRNLSLPFLLGALFFCALPLFAPVGAARAASALDAQLERLAAETARIHSLKSDFKQTKYISFMDETLVSEGFFSYQAPDRLEWQYTKPLASGLVYKDGQARLWSGPGGPGGQSGGSGEAIAKIIAEQLITWTRLDIPKLKKSYDISLLADSPLTVRLSPKNLSPGNPVRDFKLVFDADGVNVRQITLYEAEDDYTQIDFFNFQRH